MVARCTCLSPTFIIGSVSQSAPSFTFPSPHRSAHNSLFTIALLDTPLIPFPIRYPHPNPHPNPNLHLKKDRDRDRYGDRTAIQDTAERPMMLLPWSVATQARPLHPHPSKPKRFSILDHKGLQI